MRGEDRGQRALGRGTGRGRGRRERAGGTHDSLLETDTPDDSSLLVLCDDEAAKDGRLGAVSQPHVVVLLVADPPLLLHAHLSFGLVVLPKGVDKKLRSSAGDGEAEREFLRRAYKLLQWSSPRGCARSWC